MLVGCGGDPPPPADQAQAGSDQSRASQLTGSQWTGSQWTATSNSLIFRELDAADRSSAGSTPFNMDDPSDDAWLRHLLLKAPVGGWAEGHLARKVASCNPLKIDGALAKVIAGTQAVLMPQAFKVLALCGGRLPQSVEAFRQLINGRLAGVFPMDNSYTGEFLSGVIAAASRLSMDGDIGMHAFIAEARRSESFAGIAKSPVAKEIMFGVICGMAPFCPSDGTVAFLEAVDKGRYPYANRRISLILAYRASGDDFQTYIIEMVEKNPGENKYIEKYQPSSIGPLPKSHWIKRTCLSWISEKARWLQICLHRADIRTFKNEQRQRLGSYM